MENIWRYFQYKIFNLGKPLVFLDRKLSKFDFSRDKILYTDLFFFLSHPLLKTFTDGPLQYRILKRMDHGQN